MVYYVSGIPVNISRRKIKNMHLYVKPDGTVILTAPIFVSDREIISFADSKADWIAKNTAKALNSPVPADPSYADGEMIAVWGELYRLKLATGTRYALELREQPEESTDENTAVLTQPEYADEQGRKRFMRKWYKQSLAEHIDVLLPQWEAYTGLKSSGYKLRYMTSRWGSCNIRTKALTFNIRLAEHPVKCLEYVILHELAHTVVPNHGAEFKAIETKFMPDWKDVRRTLNNG